MQSLPYSGSSDGSDGGHGASREVLQSMSKPSRRNARERSRIHSAQSTRGTRGIRIIFSYHTPVCLPTSRVRLSNLSANWHNKGTKALVFNPAWNSIHNQKSERRKSDKIASIVQKRISLRDDWNSASFWAQMVRGEKIYLYIFIWKRCERRKQFCEQSIGLRRNSLSYPNPPLIRVTIMMAESWDRFSHAISDASIALHLHPLIKSSIEIYSISFVWGN